jgi:hypothetical protein
MVSKFSKVYGASTANNIMTSIIYHLIAGYYLHLNFLCMTTKYYLNQDGKKAYHIQAILELHLVKVN